MKKYNNDGMNAEDKAFNLFAEMIIKKIEGLQADWQKPWFTSGAGSWPKNISGREYNGINTLMLWMHCEDKGYKMPRFCTYNQVSKMNDEAEAKNNDLPKVYVRQGEKSFPVMFTSFSCVNKDTKERISHEDYKKLPEAEQLNYNVYPKTQIFYVFNVEQTNLQEARPELWKKLEEEYAPTKIEEAGNYKFLLVDKMIEQNLWICPITTKYQDRAYYSLTNNEIVVPEKTQFKDGPSFYGTLFHEMTHSTGAEGVLNRKIGTREKGDYAREELVAELGAAVVAQRYGINQHIKEESCAYLKGWLDNLRESPEFIKTTLTDVKKATALITQKVDAVAQTLEQEQSQGQGEGGEKKKELLNKDNKIKREYYDNGQIKYEFEVNQNEKRDGRSRTWYENGQLETEEFYIDGLQFGTQKAWWGNGKLKYEENYNPDGKEHGWRKGWHENGQLGFVAFYDNLTIDGVTKTWYSNGQLASEKNYENGKWHGVWKEWFENGVQKTEIHYKNGEKDGVDKEWHSNGKLAKECHWKNGARDGIQRTWYENGQAKDECNYVDWKKDGVEKHWYQNGNLSLEGCWKNGEPHGWHRGWNEDGSSQGEHYFKNGVRSPFNDRKKGLGI